MFRMVESPRPCSYLSGERESLDCRLFTGLEPEQLERLISRGWRRFSNLVFRPVCPACMKCVPIRVDVKNFHPSKSQRRVLRKNDDVHVEIHPPTVTDEHVRLYNAWHEDMTDRRGWREQAIDPEEYEQAFLLGNFPSLHEVRYTLERRLIGVGLIDVLPRSLSSAYFYHDPQWRDLAPGTFSLLMELELARATDRDYVYLGFWIEDCPSMAYKNRFFPHEILLQRPEDLEEPGWLKVSGGRSNVGKD